MNAAPPPRWLCRPRHSPWRWLLASATAAAALAHLPEIAPHLKQAPYLGEEFIVLTAACLLLGAAALVCDSAAIYALTILTCALAIAGYLATRLIPFPLLQDDVGNWREPLGVVSILAEGFAVLTAIIALRTTSPSLAGSHVRTRLEGPGEPLVGVQRRDLECEPLSGVVTARRGPSRRSSHRRASHATAGGAK